MKLDSHKRIRVNYILWERNDAIGKVTSNYLSHLQSKIDLNIILLDARSKNKPLMYLKNLLKISRGLLKNEIIHIEEPTNIESNLLLIFKNKKSVLTAHHVDSKSWKVINNISFLKEKIKHSSVSRLVAISKKTRQDLITQYNIPANKIEVVYHGIDHKIFRPMNNKLKGVHKKYILYLGSETPRKNIENLLKAFKIVSQKYPDIVLLKAGYSSGPQYRENTKKLIEKYGLKNKVIFAPENIAEKDLPSYYSNAELFVFPSLKEGFGMPLVEAMACGCPVVTSNIAPMNEIAQGQELVNPLSPEEIAKGMIKILSNKKYKEKLIKNGLERAKDFDWEKSANKILEIYKELDKK